MADAVTMDVASPAAPSDGLTLGRRLAIFVVLLVSEFLYGWAWNTVDVLRPYIRETLHLSLIQAGAMYSAQGAGALTGAVVIGQLADRFGRRLMLSLLIFGYGAMLLLGAMIQNYPELMAQRFLLGLFMGASFPVGVGIYVNLFAATVRGRLAAMLNVCFSGAIMSLGIAMSMIGSQDWRVLLWIGGVPPLFLAFVVLLLIPARSVVDRFHVESGKLPISELFHVGVRRQTLLLALMTGLNFFGYEAYSGWLTTYLTGDRGLSTAVAGNLVAWQFAGNIVGGFVWGYAADRFGRRFNALGFLIAATMIAIYLAVPTDLWVLRIVGLIYGGSLCASVIWGPWLAELYPPHLRSTAASIFNWGRIISFFAPLVTAKLANVFGLRVAMASASLAFAIAAVIWLCQRETFGRGSSEVG